MVACFADWKGFSNSAPEIFIWVSAVASEGDGDVVRKFGVDD